MAATMLWDHRDRMNAFWACLREVQVRIDRTQALLREIEADQKRVRIAMEAQRFDARRQARDRRWLHDRRV